MSKQAFAIEWTDHILGALYWEHAAPDDTGVIVKLRNGGHRYRLTSTGVSPYANEPGQPSYRTPPFERIEQKSMYRITWPKGSLVIRHADLTAWSNRYGVLVEERGLRLLDATSAHTMRLAFAKDLDLGWSTAHPVVTEGRLWIARERGAYSIPVAELERFAAAKATDVDVTIRSRYELRRPTARLACVYLWSMPDGRDLIEIGDGKGGANEPKLKVPKLPASLRKYDPLELVDELAPDVWARAEIPGHPPFALHDPEPRTSLTAKLRKA